ncbi:MAG TPA: EAL domain-containing protein [Thermoleophilaceae bacterium]|nr:EAL domain-containing protein [Thermoleophilaceae bacterium]
MEKREEQGTERNSGRRFGGTFAVWVLNAAILGGAFALYALNLRGSAGLAMPHQIPWWALAPVFAATEIFVVHVHFRRSAHSMSLGEVPLVVGLLLASPQDLVIAQLVGSGIVLALSPGRSLIRLVFNVAQYALAACVAASIFHFVVPAHDGLGPAAWGAAFTATIVSSAAGVLLIGAAITLSEAPVGTRRLLQMLGTSMLVTVTNTSLGLAGGTVISGDPRAAWLLAIPAITLFVSYRAYMSERQKHESLEFLYGATRSLTRAQDVGGSLQDLLELTLQAFRGELAEVILFPGEDGKTPLRTSAGSGSTDLMHPVAHDVADGLRALVGDGHSALTLVQPFPPELEAYLEERGVQNGMVSPLRGETRVVGAMLVANRLGVARGFGRDDLKLFEALANQAGASLEHDRLEQTVWRLRELQEQLEHQAFHDPLTGLANRVVFVDRVAHALARRGGSVAVLFLDLDDFKLVNDRYGHAHGDELLRQVARRVRGCLRPADTPARMGGDEFAILLEDADGPVLMDVAERIVAAFCEPFTLSSREVRVKASLGVATNSSGSETAEDLLRNADVAMYTAKTNGKDRFASFEPTMHAEMVLRHSLKEELEAAVERDEFVVEYQPIAQLSTGETVAVEALVRWQHPSRGRIAPADFIPLAEDTGLIVPIGRIVLARACRLAREWSDAHPDRAPIGVHVNASAAELQEPDLVEHVTAAIESAGIHPGQLVIEITESILISDAPVSIAQLDELRRAGIRLALDDFGTGYSSLSYLRWLPLDIVKMDKSFVSWAGHGGKGAAFARTIAELAHTLGLDVVAEGIETDEQLAAMRELGCEMGQGYWFAPPAEPSLGRGVLVRAA